MSERYVIKQGEHLANIAERYRFHNWATVWNHPENEALRAIRAPDVLFPGDELFIPDAEPESYLRPTTQQHLFFVRRRRLKLRLELLDLTGEPRVGLPCVLTVDGTRTELTTDFQGKIEHTINPSARHASLTLDGDSIPIDVGYLDPVDQPSGWQARLVNLGYLDGLPEDESEADVRSAVEEFQCDHELPVTGECDEATQQILLEVHGS